MIENSKIKVGQTVYFIDTTYGGFGLIVKSLCRSKTDTSVIWLSFEGDTNGVFERHYRLNELYKTRKEAYDVFTLNMSKVMKECLKESKIISV